MTNNEAIGILAIVVETAKGRCFVTDEAISDAYAMAISALQEQEELYVYSQCKTCRYYHDDDVRCMICDDENDMYEAQETKTQLSREDTTLGVQKTCITCKHNPPSKKWPCIDCDMRADRWEPQELSKNSTELDKENGELHTTCTGSCTGSEELKQEVKNSTESSLTQKALDTISRQEAIDAINKALDRETLVNSFVRKVAVDAVKVLPPAQPELSDAVYQLWKRAYEAGERSTQPEIIHCRDCRYSTDFYQDGCCYCKRPSKKMRYIEEGWDFYCAAGKENR